MQRKENVIEARGYRGVAITQSKSSHFPATIFQFSMPTLYTPSMIRNFIMEKKKDAYFNKENQEPKQELTRSMDKKNKIAMTERKG